MSGESKRSRRPRSTKFKEHLFPKSPFGRCVVVLADGIKPAQWLSERVKRWGGKCSERHANLLIAGKRKPGTRVALAVYIEIIS